MTTKTPVELDGAQKANIHMVLNSLPADCWEGKARQLAESTGAALADVLAAGHTVPTGEYKLPANFVYANAPK